MSSSIPKIPPEVREDAWLLFCHHIEQPKIAEILEVNYNTLRQWVMKGKWTERRKRIEEMMEHLKPKDERPIVKAIARSRVEAKRLFEEKTGVIAAADVEHWADNMNPEERLAAAPNIKALNECHRKNLGLDEEKEHDTRHVSLSFLTNPTFRVLDAIEVKQIEDKNESPTT